MNYFLSLLLLLLLNSCVIQRSVVRQPQLSVAVFAQNQVAIPNANVYLYWWFNPYSSLEASQSFVTDVKGFVRLPEVLQTEMSFPLMIHGVKEYQHTLCIQVAGYRTLVMTLRASPKDNIVLETPLNPGESLPICQSFDSVYNHPGSSRPDIEQQHPAVEAAYEIEF